MAATLLAAAIFLAASVGGVLAQRIDIGPDRPDRGAAVARAAGPRRVEEGRIALDGDINERLTSWQIPQGEFRHAKPVTPRALLSHTSGASDGFGFPGYDPSEPQPTLVQILRGEHPSNVGPVLFDRPPFAASN